MPRLSPDHLFTLHAAVEIRNTSALVYNMPAALQREAWKAEAKESTGTGLGYLDQDLWLVDVANLVDAVHPEAPIFLLDDQIDIFAHGKDEVPLDGSPRIVVWKDLVAFIGNRLCYVFYAGTSRYLTCLDGSWAPEALGMYAVSLREPERRQLSTTERHGLAKAKIKPRRDVYYVTHTRYESTAPRPEPKGGHHASPVAHDRSAHQALLTRVSVDPAEAEDLKARQYTLAWTEELPEVVRLRMTQRGKSPLPGTLNAYRWVEKRATRVNPAGEHAMKVTVLGGQSDALSPQSR